MVRPIETFKFFIKCSALLFMALILFVRCGGETEAPAPVEGALKFDRMVLDGDAYGPAFVTLGDMNADGKTDLIVSKFGKVDMATFTIPNGQVTAYLQGDSLQEWTQMPIVTPEDGIIWPNDVTLYDVDGDGDMDVFVPGGFLACAFIPGGKPCGSLQWFENTPDGFTRHNIVEMGDKLFYHLALLEDLDGDGIDDLLTVGEERPMPGTGPDQAVTMWFKGNLSATRFETEPRIIGEGLGSIPTFIDLDGDGDLDLASAEFFAGMGASFTWFEQVSPPSDIDPAGVWTRHVIDDTVGPSIQLSFVPNLIGDGKLMAVGSNHTNTAKSPADPWESAVYMYSIPDDPREPWVGTKISEGIVSVAGLPTAPQAAPGIFGTGDAEGDGDIDIIVSGDGDPNVYLLEQTAPGVFKTWIFDADNKQAGGMKITDLNGDGIAEIVTTGYENSAIYLYTRDASGVHPLETVGGTDTSDASPSIAEDEVVLRVDYAGQTQGNLIVSLYPGTATSGTPAAFSQLGAASFPADIKLEKLAPGAYTAVITLDAAPFNIMAPGPEDVTLTMPVNVPNNTAPIAISLGAPVTPVDPGALGPNDVKLTINYEGPETGDVIIAAFPSLPPAGPPSKYLKIPAVMAFPFTETIKDMPSGTYQIAIYLDLAPFDPAMWGDEDPTAETASITVGEGAVELDVTLTK